MILENHLIFIYICLNLNYKCYYAKLKTKYHQKNLWNPLIIISFLWRMAGENTGPDIWILGACLEWALNLSSGNSQQSLGVTKILSNRGTEPEPNISCNQARLPMEEQRQPSHKPFNLQFHLPTRYAGVLISQIVGVTN